MVRVGSLTVAALIRGRVSWANLIARGGHQMARVADGDATPMTLLMATQAWTMPLDATLHCT
jgi:cytolysin (calcineurin-like family phosphatase)